MQPLIADSFLNATIFDECFMFIIGLVFGSFATLLSYRLPEGGAIMVARSQCPKCQHKLGVLDLFPVLSWLWNKMRCRYCKAPVSIRYPLIELCMGTGFWLIYLLHGWQIVTLLPIGAFFCFMVIAIMAKESRYTSWPLWFITIGILVLYGVLLNPVLLA